MITAAIALFAISLPMQDASLVCPIMGQAVNAKSPSVMMNGIKFSFCCPGCDSKFKKDPKGSLAAAEKKGWLAGESLFDPMTGSRITADKAKSKADFRGIRYYFASPQGASAFTAEPAKFAAVPAREALFCPVMKKAVAGYDKASGYADHDGVRYYFCCAGCDVKFKANPASFAGNAARNVKPAALGASAS